MCAAIVGGVTGTAAEIRTAGKILDILEMEPAQAQLIGLRQSQDGAMDWQDKDTVWPLDFDPKAVEYIHKAVIAFSGWSARDTKRVDALLSKLAPSK